MALVQESEWLEAQQVLDQTRELEARHDAASAAVVLESFVARRRLSGPERGEVLAALGRCRMLACWERFDYAGALRWARSDPALAREFAGRLSVLEGAVRRLASPGGVDLAGPLALIGDLRENARRCAERGRFDDAVGRLYRATELLAQARLRSRYGLHTGDLAVDHPAIPFASRERLERLRGAEDGRVRVSLVAGYRLLEEMGDPLGRYFAERQEVMQLLEARNHSLFAHGLEPIGVDRWRELGSRWEAWLKEAEKRLGEGEEASI